MKGVRISMLYEYFTAQERKIQEKIDLYESKSISKLSSDDLRSLEYLKFKKEFLKQIFSDVFDLVVDFDTK